MGEVFAEQIQLLHLRPQRVQAALRRQVELGQHDGLGVGAGGTHAADAAVRFHALQQRLALQDQRVHRLLALRFQLQHLVAEPDLARRGDQGVELLPHALQLALEGVHRGGQVVQRLHHRAGLLRRFQDALDAGAARVRGVDGVLDPAVVGAQRA